MPNIAEEAKKNKGLSPVQWDATIIMGLIIGLLAVTLTWSLTTNAAKSFRYEQEIKLLLQNDSLKAIVGAYTQTLQRQQQNRVWVNNLVQNLQMQTKARINDVGLEQARLLGYNFTVPPDTGATNGGTTP